MKTLALTLAAAATLIAGAANAASFGNDDNLRVHNPNKQTLFGGAVLDAEPTASVVAVAGEQIFTTQEFINGREATVKRDASGAIISKSYTGSDR